MGFCKNCVHYEPDIFQRGSDKFGVCSHSVASVSVVVDREQRLTEDGIMYTREYYGCIYYQEKNRVLIDIKKAVDGYRK